ncbi:MAG: nitrous oxide reductase accessory protein NosL [Chitinophagales bacterium]
MRKGISAILITLLLTSCNSNPEPINYGKDLCTSCKMTIMDQKFGGELINDKGKIIKFDSGECMIAYRQADNDFKVAKQLVANYANPGELIEADKAFYLHGGEVNSPMGGNLAAFKTREEAEKFQKDLSGDLILWNNVTEIHF